MSRPAAVKSPKTGKRRIALYPGTFDPVTLGHLDIMERAMKLCDHLIVAVARSEGKGPLYDPDFRVNLVREDLNLIKDKHGATVEVVYFDTLLVDFAAECEATMIVRGLRAVSDFEFEFQMVGMNAYLSDIETVFLMAQDRFQFISSRFVKEIAKLGGDITPFVSKNVAKALKKQFTKDRI